MKGHSPMDLFAARDREDWLKWLEAINEDSDLSSWEISFIDHLNELVDRYGRDNLLLSEKQARVLERIYREKSGESSI